MTTITQQYNVSVESRYYAFLQEDLESAEPDTLLACVERKKEKTKEEKTKAKKEKRNKQITETKQVETEECKEPTKSAHQYDNNSEEVTDVTKNETDNKESDFNDEGKTERFGNRGRFQNYRRNNYNGPRRFNQNRPEEETEGVRRPYFDRPNTRGRPYRRERTDDDQFNKSDSYEDKGNNFRDGPPRGRGRRPYSRGGYRDYDTEYNRENEFTEKMVNFDDNQDFGESRRPERGRFPRRSRGGFNRFNPSYQENSENDGDQGENVGYFDSNKERRPFRGSRGGFRRSSRGMRRGRGGFQRPKGEGENDDCYNNRDNNEQNDRHEATSKEKWPTYDENGVEVVEQPVQEPITMAISHTETEAIPTQPNLESDLTDFRKSNWCEIEDDHPLDSGVAEVAPTMTLEEWKAANQAQYGGSASLAAINSRKANDGQDVFSGMEEYRKEGRVSDDHVPSQGEQTAAAQTIGIKQKAPIPVAIRFSRAGPNSGGGSGEYSGSYVHDSGEQRGASSSGGYYGGRGGRGYRGGDRGDRGGGFRGGSFRGSSDRGDRGGGYRDSYRGDRGGGGERGYQRGGGRPYRRMDDNNGHMHSAAAAGSNITGSNITGNNINLGNEEEFPTLS